MFHPLTEPVGDLVVVADVRYPRSSLPELNHTRALQAFGQALCGEVALDVALFDIDVLAHFAEHPIPVWGGAESFGSNHHAPELDACELRRFGSVRARWNGRAKTGA